MTLLFATSKTDCLVDMWLHFEQSIAAWGVHQKSVDHPTTNIAAMMAPSNAATTHVTN